MPVVVTSSPLRFAGGGYVFTSSVVGAPAAGGIGGGDGFTTPGAFGGGLGGGDGDGRAGKAAAMATAAGKAMVEEDTAVATAEPQQVVVTVAATAEPVASPAGTAKVVEEMARYPQAKPFEVHAPS